MIVVTVVPVVGKGRGGLLVKRGRACQTVGGKTPEMLSDDAKTRAGNRDISPIILVGNQA
ncbi:hypothetical protein EKTHUN627_03360 [Enterobacter kobei]|nr:hypothetical protein EKTHUN627_03360 [Enterobacter kobei]